MKKVYLFILLFFCTIALHAMQQETSDQQENPAPLTKQVKAQTPLSQLSVEALQLAFKNKTLHPYHTFGSGGDTVLHQLAQNLKCKKIFALLGWYPIMPKNSNHYHAKKPFEYAQDHLYQQTSQDPQKIKTKVQTIFTYIKLRNLDNECIADLLNYDTQNSCTYISYFKLIKRILKNPLYANIHKYQILVEKAFDVWTKKVECSASRPIRESKQRHLNKLISNINDLAFRNTLYNMLAKLVDKSKTGCIIL